MSSSQCVNFKVYFPRGPDGCGCQVRVLSFPTENLTFGDVWRRIADCWPHSDDGFEIQYEDDEGDRITIGSHNEFEQTNWRKRPSLKLYVHPAELEVGLKGKAGQAVHPSCHVCHQIIVGFVFRCLVCSDIHMCARCERAGNHHTHDLLRLKTANSYPEQLFQGIKDLYERLGVTLIKIDHDDNIPPLDIVNDDTHCLRIDLNNNNPADHTLSIPITLGSGFNEDDPESNKFVKDFETIQELQGEIDKLLAPLSDDGATAVSSIDGDHQTAPSPFSLNGDGPNREIIVEKAGQVSFSESQFADPNAIIENPNYQAHPSHGVLTVKPAPGSRPSRPTRNSEGETFDEIIVDEEVEVTNEAMPDFKGESDESEPVKDEVSNHVTSARSKSNETSVEIRNEPIYNDPLARMELRRALHRAGLDSSLASRSSSRMASNDIHEDKMSRGHIYNNRSFSGDIGANGGSTNNAAKISEARKQMLAMGFSDDDGWLTELITLKRGNLDEVLEVLAPVHTGRY